MLDFSDCLIYFTPGAKHLKLVLDGFDYVITRRVEDRTFWKCAQYGRTACRARLSTSGKELRLTKVRHTHRRRYKANDLNEMMSQRVVVVTEH